MPDEKVLVIDDSTTIRRLVDTHLSPEGYHVTLAATAEEGLDLAAEILPDLILLDHQLPGTTGCEVAKTLSESPSLRHIPVVISSTQRKKAYVEYVDLDNVVDMLPKPYTEELLRTTVANAIETAAMIVQSQEQGSAVPETIQSMGQSALNGSFQGFTLREILDFLNNGRKVGVLEVEAGTKRIRFSIDKGRIQAVHAAGISSKESEELCSRLPDSLSSLAPILKMTLAGRNCADSAGFIELLDRKMLDPRLLTRLLKFQAASLVRHCFKQELGQFFFESGTDKMSVLSKSVPLDCSLLAMLVEGALYDSDPQVNLDNVVFVRRLIRGQSLDRAGLSAKHMKLHNALSEPKSLQELQQILKWPADELIRVLEGFEMADLVERRKQSIPGQFVVFEPDAGKAQTIRESLEASDNRYAGKVVRDKLALKLVLKRCIPHTMIFSADSQQSLELIGRLFQSKDPRLKNVKRIVLSQEKVDGTDWMTRVGFQPDGQLSRPCSADTIFKMLDRLFVSAERKPAEETATRIEATRRIESGPSTAAIKGGHEVGA